GLGTAGLNDSKNYVNTASIGNASLAIGMMTQSLGTIPMLSVLTPCQKVWLVPLLKVWLVAGE
ncbi:MAG: hypothetical protein ACLRU1_04980, partial [Veillonella parvula]